MGGTHNVQADNGSFGNAASSSWTSFPVVFNSAGTFEYFCEVHSAANLNNMNGTVIVTGGAATPRRPAVQHQQHLGRRERRQQDDHRDPHRRRRRPGLGRLRDGQRQRDLPDRLHPDQQRLNWADNDDNPKTFPVPIVNDSTEEPSQSFTIRLSEPGRWGDARHEPGHHRDDQRRRRAFGQPGDDPLHQRQHRSFGQRGRGEHHPHRRTHRRLDRPGLGGRQHGQRLGDRGRGLSGDHQRRRHLEQRRHRQQDDRRTDRRRHDRGAERDLHRDSSRRPPAAPRSAARRPRR